VWRRGGCRPGDIKRGGDGRRRAHDRRAVVLAVRRLVCLCGVTVLCLWYDFGVTVV
jgi:hypothetical protein